VKRILFKLFVLFWIALRFSFAGKEAPNQTEDEGAIIIKKAEEAIKRAEEAIGCIGHNEKLTSAVSEAAMPDEAVRWMVKAVDDEDQGRLQDAISDCKEVVRVVPQDSLSWFSLARLFEKTEQYQEALDAYSEILEFEPGNFAARFQRGYLYQRQGAYDKAMADVSDVIRWHADCASAYSLRGQLYNRMGEYDKAIADADRAIQMNPRDLDAHLTRGFANLQVKNYERAAQDLTEGLNLTPKDGYALSHRAAAFTKLGKYKEALADLVQASELDGKAGIFEAPAADVLNSLAWLLATCPDSAVRNGEKATEYVSRALKLDPDRWQLWDTRAAVFAENCDFGNAVRWEERCLGQKDFSEAERGRMEGRLALYRAEKPYREQAK
jgi:tetratricopeptide (TPR) repeat protein